MNNIWTFRKQNQTKASESFSFCHQDLMAHRLSAVETVSSLVSSVRTPPNENGAIVLLNPPPPLLGNEWVRTQSHEITP